MTNRNIWDAYLANNHAPLQFKEAAFYFCISAALERRVWVSSGVHKIFANNYVLFVAPAGKGKGLATNTVAEVLTHHKDPADVMEPDPEKRRPLISMGPSGGSYQRLIARMAESSRAITIVEDGKARPYAYTSCCMILDEFTSMFTEHASEAVTFFCSAWSGNMPYERDTNSRGRLMLYNPSISFIAGTTPKNIRTLFKYDIIGKGLDRRMLVVYAERAERAQFDIPPASDEAKRNFKLFLEHILLLTKVAGQLKYCPEAIEWARAWWVDVSRRDVNKHPMLADYHESKSALVHKLAIAIHMSEGEPAKRMAEPISRETVQEAVRMLHSYESVRDLAYKDAGQNDKYVFAMTMIDMLRTYKEMSVQDFQDRLYQMTDQRGVQEVTDYLIRSRRMEITNDGKFKACEV